MNAIVAAIGARPRTSALFDYENRFRLCLVLTLLLLLLYSDHYWYIKIPLSVLAIAGFIHPGFRASRVLWGVAVLVIAAGTYNNWYTVDNHKYLLGYWCLAIFFALLTSPPERSLEVSARWLMVLVFLLAVVHKTLSTDYLNGTFFYYELLLDERFAGLARYVGGLPDHMKTLNDAARRALITFDSTLTAVQLEGTPNTARLASFITWWNYLIQAVIAAAFVLPRTTLLARGRHAVLLVFLFTTYLFAPVIGFGWVLAIMGIAQTERDEVRTRVLYVTAFLFLQIYRLPWSALFSVVPGFGSA